MGGNLSGSLVCGWYGTEEKNGGGRLGGVGVGSVGGVCCSHSRRMQRTLLWRGNERRPPSSCRVRHVKSTHPVHAHAPSTRTRTRTHTTHVLCTYTRTHVHIHTHVVHTLTDCRLLLVLVLVLVGLAGLLVLVGLAGVLVYVVCVVGIGIGRR